MAIPPPNVLAESWVLDAFVREFAEYRPTFFTDAFRKRLPTVDSIKADVTKLRSVSAAGRALIADRRMAIAGVGPWRDVFVLKDKDGRYPAIICKARQQGLTYTTTIVQKA